MPFKADRLGLIIPAGIAGALSKSDRAIGTGNADKAVAPIKRALSWQDGLVKGDVLQTRLICEPESVADASQADQTARGLSQCNRICVSVLLMPPLDRRSGAVGK